jgi:REP-associated tyrosine transposase
MGSDPAGLTPQVPQAAPVKVQRQGCKLMPRSPRQDHEGAWQHVMNRGLDRQAVFGSDDDRQIFYDCLAAAMPRYGVQLHAYCLLDNHFHLLLFSESGRLSDAMRFLGGRFTQRINYREGRDGPLFRGRFTSVPVKSDAHLVQASRYIHRNPVEAGLVAEPWLWAWSSAQAYLGLTRTPAWLHTEAILEMLGPQNARQRYRELLGEEIGVVEQAAYGEVAAWGQTRRV